MAFFLQRRIQPLQSWVSKLWNYSSLTDPSRVSAKDPEKRILTSRLDLWLFLLQRCKFRLVKLFFWLYSPLTRGTCHATRNILFFCCLFVLRVVDILFVESFVGSPIFDFTSSASWGRTPQRWTCPRWVRSPWGWWQPRWGWSQRFSGEKWLNAVASSRWIWDSSCREEAEAHRRFDFLGYIQPKGCTQRANCYWELQPWYLWVAWLISVLTSFL
jgi:hypothetical protein